MKATARVLLLGAVLPFSAPAIGTAKVPLPWAKACPCEWRAPGVFWQDKADFVRCAAAATHAAVAAHEITERRARSMIRLAARGVPCGKPSYTRRTTCGGPRRRPCRYRGDACFYVGPVCTDGRWGFCVPRGCSTTGAVVPVCGCDGKTYPNGCTAVNRDVEIAHAGACEGGPPAP
jgi:hypothetical protein